MDINHVRKDIAFIFDLDGVIVDSNPVHLEVWREYLQNLGSTVDDKLPELMYGRRNDEIVRDLLGDTLTPEEIFAHGAAKEALYRERMRPQLKRRLVPGVIDFLERHASIPKGLATNAEPANAEFVISEAGLSRFFQVVVDGHKVENPKPAPDIYLLAAALLKKEPGECVVFEDSAAGIQAARSAGMRVVALSTTHSELEGPDLVVANFLAPELEAWLGTI